MGVISWGTIIILMLLTACGVILSIPLKKLYERRRWVGKLVRVALGIPIIDS